MPFICSFTHSNCLGPFWCGAAVFQWGFIRKEGRKLYTFWSHVLFNFIQGFSRSSCSNAYKMLFMSLPRLGLLTLGSLRLQMFAALPVSRRVSSRQERDLLRAALLTLSSVMEMIRSHPTSCARLEANLRGAVISLVTEVCLASAIWMQGHV